MTHPLQASVLKLNWQWKITKVISINFVPVYYDAEASSMFAISGEFSLLKAVKHHSVVMAA